MSIFRRDAPSETPEPSAPAGRRPVASAQPSAAEKPTIIAAGARIQGEVTGKADLTIDGRVEGKIVLERDVTVRNQGMVNGRIQARSVRIGGKVVGDVKGVELVEITSSGSLEGNVSAARVIIAEGAFFKGQVEMTGDRSGASRKAR